MIANNHSINDILFRWVDNTRVFKPYTEIQEKGHKKIYGNTGCKIEESKEMKRVPFAVFSLMDKITFSDIFKVFGRRIRSHMSGVFKFKALKVVEGET